MSGIHFGHYRASYIKQHLNNFLNCAKKNNNEESKKNILSTIQREKDRSFWGRLNYSMSNIRGGSVRSVQIEQDRGEIDEATMQQTVHESIWDKIHRKRFYLAEQSQICKVILRDDFGYTAL